MMVFAIMQWCALCHHHPGSGCSNHSCIVVVRRSDFGMLSKTAFKTYYRTNRITKVDAYGSPVMYKINTVTCTRILFYPIT